jgi:hypothetical protein
VPSHLERHSPQPSGFDFTEAEKLWDGVSDNRLRAWLADPQTVIHSAELSSNSYGEFLFITLSRGDQHYTFYGYGLHEQRETWITDTWRYYSTTATKKTLEQRLTATEAQWRLNQRQREIEAERSTDNEAPSQRAILFALLADLTDEDGAMSELDDLGDFSDLFDDE